MSELEIKVLETKSKLLEDILDNAEICLRGMINEVELGRRVLETYNTFLSARRWGAFDPRTSKSKCEGEGIEDDIPINVVSHGSESPFYYGY